MAAGVHKGHDFQLFRGLMQVREQDQVLKLLHIAQACGKRRKNLDLSLMLLGSHGLYGHAHGMLERAVYTAYGLQNNGFVHQGSTASTT